MTKQILVNAFYSGSPLQLWTGLWTHPESQSELYNRLSFWTDLARLAEGGLIDGIFMGDSLGLSEVYDGKPDALMRSAGMFPVNDPMMMIPAMATVTENLCFGVTGNTTYEPPYLLARRLSTLDQLTNGRLSWNIVTGVLESTAKAMGVDMIPHDQRYDIADEYMDLMYKLWEQSWDDDAAVRDRAARTFIEPVKVRKISHDGRYRCEGYHLCEPSPQRTPFLYSAGASGKGMAFAGKHAEAAFMSANNRQHGKIIVDGYRSAAKAAGRAPDSLKIFNAVTIVVAPTESEAKDLVREYQEHSSGEGNLAILSGIIGVDLSKYGWDDPLEHVESNAIQSMLDAITKQHVGDKVRIRDLAAFMGMPGSESFIVGSSVQVCDALVRWLDDTGMDGINLTRTVEPAGLRSFVDLVVPELQNRGRYKTDYAPGTMREKTLGAGGAHLANDHYGASFRYEREPDVA